jgi:hypothetical protein
MDYGRSGSQSLSIATGSIRRQLGLWKRWPPWAALIGIVVIAGPRLSQFVWGIECFRSVTTVAAYFQSVEHFHGQDWTTVPEARDILFFLCFAIVVIIWSWMSGFVLSALSGRTIWLTGFLLYLIVLNFARMANGVVRLHGPGAPPLPTFLSDRLEPFTKDQVFLFFVPVMLGMRSGLRRTFLCMHSAVFMAGLILCATLVLIEMSAVAYGIDTAHGSVGAWGAPALNWQTVLVSWPVVYMIVTARRDQRAGIL